LPENVLLEYMVDAADCLRDSMSTLSRVAQSCPDMRDELSQCMDGIARNKAMIDGLRGRRHREIHRPIDGCDTVGMFPAMLPAAA
jgi:hypothetical protein